MGDDTINIAAAAYAHSVLAQLQGSKTQSKEFTDDLFKYIYKAYEDGFDDGWSQATRETSPQTD